MARNITSNSGVANSWAGQHHDRAESNNGNFWHAGTKLYSYSTCIAQMHFGKNSRPVALFTRQTYSVTTTGKHENPAYSQCCQNNIAVFKVPDFKLNSGHATNLLYLETEITLAVASIENAQVRKPIGSWDADRPERCYDKLVVYCECFGIELPRVDLHRRLGAAYVKWEARRAEYLTPRKVEQRKRANARRMLIGLVNGKPVKPREEHWA